MRIRLLWLVAVLCALAAPSFAQTGVPTSYNLRVYAPAATTPTSLTAIPLSAVTCGITNKVAVPAAREVRWDDPADPNRDCSHVTAANTGPLAVLGDGAYEATLQAVNADGSGPESARRPFVQRRSNPPGVVTGLRVQP